MPPAQIAPTADTLPDSTAGGQTSLAVAIIGAGPRGLAAAEALAATADPATPVALTVIDDTPCFGAGPNYDPDQPDLNRLNVPLRAIEIPTASYPGATLVPFADWMAQTRNITDPEHYPARAALGQYFVARWQELAANPPEGLTIKSCVTTVTGLERAGAAWRITTKTETLEPFSDILLAVGHQAVTDPQIAGWKDHAASSQGTFMPAYPSAPLKDAANDWMGKTVAIRGLGLSTIDVIRILTEGQGGQFETGPDGALAYRPSGKEPASIVPFSLNGIPPAPKPATAEIDALYDLDKKSEALFIGCVSNLIAKGIENPLPQLAKVLLDAAAPVIDRFALDKDRLAHWLEVEIDPKATYPIDERPVREILSSHLAMAENREPPSPGFAIGQVWRKLQTPLRKGYNPLQPTGLAAEDFVRFDEGMKRFSYGPPPQAASQLLALIDAGLLDLRAVDDPDITTVQTGWRLSEDHTDTTAQVMIDAVLPAGDLEKSAAPLIVGLRETGLLTQLGEKLGANIYPDGTAIDAQGNSVPGLAILGRMATGSVIATDSVHDCFGAAVQRWARSVRENARAAAVR